MKRQSRVIMATQRSSGEAPAGIGVVVGANRSAAVRKSLQLAYHASSLSQQAGGEASPRLHTIVNSYAASNGTEPPSDKVSAEALVNKKYTIE